MAARFRKCAGGHAARSWSAWAVVLLAMIAVVRPGVAYAQAEPVSVEIGLPERGYVGDAVPLVVTVNGSREAQPPAWPEIDGTEIQFLRSEDRSSSFTMSINGQTTTRRTTTVVMVFEVRFARTGEFELPSVPVTVGSGSGSRQLTTDPARIRIEEPARDPEFGLEIALETADAYVGQPVEATITWIVAKPVRNVRFSMPFDPSLLRVLPGPSSAGARTSAGRSGGTRVMPVRPDPREFETVLNGETVVARIDERVIGGQRRQTLTIDAVLIPQRPGVAAVGPVRVDYDAVVGQRPRRFTDAPWDDLSILERQASLADRFDVRVSALPTEGRPADFSGLVGRYSVEAAARPTSASVGEPIDLTVVVRGPHPISLVPPLDLASRLRSESRLRVPTDPLLPTVQDGAAVFTARVRARSDTLTELPPIGLSYFDPYEGAYRVAQSQPVTIQIRPSATIGLPDDDENDAAVASQRGVLARSLPNGMADLDRREAAVSGGATEWVERLASDWILAVSAAGPAAYLGSLAFVAIAGRRGRERSGNRVRTAARVAARRTRSADDRGLSERDAGLILRALMGSCAGVEGRAVTGPEAIGWIPHGVAPADRDRLARLVLAPDGEFDPAHERSGGSSDQRVTRGEVIRLIRVVARRWRDTDRPERRAA